TRDAGETLSKYGEENVIFSWRFFDRGHDLFNCGNVDLNWFINYMDTLRNISHMKTEEFMQHLKPPLRVHSHDWSRVSAKFRINNEIFDQIKDDAYQFAISKARGRVHGF